MDDIFNNIKNELSDDTDKELYNFCPLVTYSIHNMLWSISNYRYYLEHYP